MSQHFLSKSSKMNLNMNSLKYEPIHMQLHPHAMLNEDNT